MVTVERIEHTIRAMDDPVVTVADVRDALDVDASDTHVRQKMDVLDAAGTLEKKKVGARAVAYWHSERVTAPTAGPADHPDQSELESAADADGAVSDESGASEDGAEWTVDAAVDAVDLPGRGEVVEQREEALRGALMHLRDGGEASAEELKDLTFDHHETGYKNARSWWKNCASPALSTLRDEGAVRLVDGHDGVWAWGGSR